MMLNKTGAYVSRVLPPPPPPNKNTYTMQPMQCISCNATHAMQCNLYAMQPMQSNTCNAAHAMS